MNKAWCEAVESKIERALDVGWACLGCLVFAPVMLGAGAAIRLEDGGPILFRQERLGARRSPFEVFKLRTMRGAEVTRVGRWLRATGVDEVPQFLNVLRGEMRVVGPRPLTAADVEALEWTGPAHDSRWSVRPGITGLAQLFADSAGPETFAWDEVYLTRRSALLDAELIAWSFLLNLIGKGPVRSLVRRVRGFSLEAS